jgi:hypothetical protein
MYILYPTAKNHDATDKRCIQQIFLQAAKITEILTAQGTAALLSSQYITRLLPTL